MTIRDARLFGKPFDVSLAREAVVSLGRQIPRRCVNVSTQRSPGGIEPPWSSYQTEEAIMRHIFRGFDGSQQPVRESKDGIAVTLIQDLKGCCISVGSPFEQPLICYLIRQSKRSIL
jgi:hypothetical protein